MSKKGVWDGPSEALKRRALEQVIIYEFNMLGATLTLLNSNTRDYVAAQFDDIFVKCIRNALFEAFLTHFRCLIEFFEKQPYKRKLGDKRNDKTIIRADYLGGRRKLWWLDDDTRERINKYFAHMDYARIVSGKKITLSEINVLYSKMRREIEIFWRSMKKSAEGTSALFESEIAAWTSTLPAREDSS